MGIIRCHVLYDRALNWQASPHALVQHSHGVIVDIICRSSNMDLICFAVVKSVSSCTLLSTDLRYIFGLVGFGSEIDRRHPKSNDFKPVDPDMMNE